MENFNPEKIQGAIVVGFTVVLAVSLLVNGAQAVAGSERFHYWNLPIFALCVAFTKEYLRAYAPRQLAELRQYMTILIESLVKVANSISEHIRASLATFRALLNNLHIQTEP